MFTRARTITDSGNEHFGREAFYQDYMKEKRSMLSGLVAVAIFSSTICYGCMNVTADPVPAEELDFTAAESSLSERTAEAQEPVTSDECWAAYKRGEAVCRNERPDAALGCFIVIKALLAVCLRNAR